MGGGERVTQKGCRHLCVKTLNQFECCKQYWGPTCQNCPGGPDNSCNRHGICLDGITGNGRCVCEARYKGFACEECVDETASGPDCVPAACEGPNCPNRTVCVTGEKRQECQERCGPGVCDRNAECELFGEGHRCTCRRGFLGDGSVCLPLNPCSVNNGGCPQNSTTCQFDGQNQAQYHSVKASLC
uniref:EGF-like domain-containing protein n=2 Tax=Callorhinchus milii TaxID=7868 RepID=A0A4W3ID47_CALMI